MQIPSPRQVIVPGLPGLSHPAVRLLVASATILFCELLLIRWIPANVVYIGFFSNFLLIGSFLGIGVGILLGRRIGYAPLFGPLLFGVVALVLVAKLDIQLRATNEIFFGLSESQRADTNFIVLPAVVGLVTLLLAALALPLGPLLRAMPPLRAYAVDIAGSLLGIGLFTLVSASGTPPPVWFAVLGLLLLLGVLGSGIRMWSLVGGCSMLAVIYLTALLVVPGSGWSAYYRLTYGLVEDGENAGTYVIDVNGIPHQQMYALSAPAREQFYEQVYQWYPERRFPKVLIVGAGSGNDAATALAHGASQVDAVEIDAAIQQLGVAHHPNRPYDDPRVNRITNDGRAFLRGTDQRYDLIIFALPDSLTLVSTTANIRLESFLFTQEAMESVREHLAPDGVFVLYNYYRQPWLVEKLGKMLETSFGQPPLVQTYAHLGGQAAVLATSRAPLPATTSENSVQLQLKDAPAPATDDWPFLYLRFPEVAPYYVHALALVLLGGLALVAGAARVAGTSLRLFSPHFFLLGVAFLLLETRSLATFGLLFGTTWVVNVLVFAGILLSVLLSIGVSARWRIPPRLLYALLFASLGAAFLISPAALLFDPPWLRYLTATVLGFAPVFCANLVFSASFKDARRADMAFASNLLGAVVGGALEYLALITGYRALLLVVALCYALACLSTRWPGHGEADDA